ncbi:MAG: Na/Pi symporter [Cyclobacteriaceae bacterium]
MKKASINSQKIFRVVAIIATVLLFFVSLKLMGASLNAMGTDTVQSFITGANNPFIGLFIGLLATAIIQSSSTTTSTAVALVGTGAIDFSTAIPIILGANIGTTVTAALVSLAFLGQKRKLRKAISVALSHNFFNVIVVIILFPLEYQYGLLTRTSVFISGLFNVSSGALLMSEPNNGSLIDPIFTLIGNDIITLIISFALLVVSIKLLAKQIYQILVASRSSDFKNAFKNPYKSFSFGFLVTAGIQSSSITTSFAIPVAATGKISLKDIFPFILGANIGTTVTAFIAAIFTSQTAIVIAIAHLLINIFGVLLFMPFPLLRNGIVNFSKWFSIQALKYRLVGFLYLLLIFFLIPFTLIYLNITI